MDSNSNFVNYVELCDEWPITLRLWSGCTSDLQLPDTHSAKIINMISLIDMNKLQNTKNIICCF